MSGRLVDCFLSWLVGGSVGRSDQWLVSRLIGSVEWLIRLVDFVGWLVGSFINPSVGWLVD